MPEPPANDSEFVALLTEHQSAIRYYVSSLLPGDSRAADVAQQANIKIWEKRDDFEIGSNFKAWAFAVARYEVLNFRKKEARDSRLQFSDELEEIMATELATASDDFDIRREALKSCLKKLKTADLALIRHRYYDAAPLKEFAAANNRSAAGLKVTLHRIRNALGKCVESNLARKEAGL